MVQTWHGVSPVPAQMDSELARRHLLPQVDGPAHKETPTVKPGEGIWNVQFAPSVPGTYKVRSWPRLCPHPPAALP